MKLRHRIPLLAILFALAGLVAPPPATAQGKAPLDHSAYDIWRGIGETVISRDGAWVAYQITLQDGDPELVVRSTSDATEYRVPRGGDARFSPSSAHLVMLVAPARAEVRQARLDDVPGPQRPKSQLGVLSLADGSVRTFDRVKSFAVPEEAGAWVAFLHEAEVEEETAEAGESEEGVGDRTARDDRTGRAARHPLQQPEIAAENAEDTAAAPDKDEGTTLVLLDLATGAELPFASVMEYAAAVDGGRLAFTTSTADGTGDGVWLVDPAEGTPRPLLEGAGHYAHLALDRPGHHVAFLSDRDSYGNDQPAFELWASSDGAPAERVAAASDLEDGWCVSQHAAPSFSNDGSRLFFGSAPRPEPEADEEPMLEEERVKVDIWHWQDPLLQPQQLLQAEEERERSHRAVVHLDSGTVVQLADETMPEVELLDGGDADVALGTSGLPYRMEISWDFPRRSDLYRVDLRDGDREIVRHGQRGPVEMSPDGRWLIWWDEERLAWMARDIETDDATDRDITSAIGHAVHDEDHDWAYEPQPYGIAGWTKALADDSVEGAAGVAVVVYDRFDLWALDPAGVAPPRSITSGAGRDDGLRFRHVDLEREEEWLQDELLLSGFDVHDKDAGFWSVATTGGTPPAALVREARRFGRPTKAADADVLVYTREDVVEFPDLWVADTDFSQPRKISDVNPQQSDYNWATAELTTWRSLDGEVLQGLVHKPEDFDPSRKYPMMVYFYERNADNLHQHHAPTPHRSVIRPTFYASRGYVVFTPDITYQVGYPGESALKDVVSGVLHMIDQGYVDEANIGTQGHSWGGYQIAYLVTKTDIFKAAAGGAPVSNMTSAYGGIRWGTGLSRMFQYERTQSRLGATLWEAPLRYLENSPLFWADKVETPLMMMHNDHDGAVPWYQGIEMFVALRRLGKPAWLVNYNDEPHWPTTYANKVDWNIRMQQFFDHYLKGAPAPVWLAEGIPAVDKGETLGLELIER